MKKVLRILCFAVLLSIFLFSFSGCWSADEINTKAIIMGISVDFAEGGEKYLVTAQIAVPSQLKSDSAGSEKAYINVAAEGAGIQATLHEFESSLSRKIYTGHTELIIFSEEVAKSGLSPVLDYFYRSSEARFSVPIIIAEGKAADLLDTKVDLEKMPVSRILGILANHGSDVIMSRTTMGDLLREMVTKNSATTLALFSTIDERPAMNKAALIKGDKMIGSLSIEQQHYELLVNGEYEEGIIVCKINDDKVVSFRITKCVTEQDLKYENGEFSADIDIYITAQISGVTFGGEEYTTEARKEIEQILHDFVTDRIMEVLQITKDMNADTVGFCEMLYRKYPRESKELLENWDENYKNFPINVMVSAKLTATGAVQERIK